MYILIHKPEGRLTLNNEQQLQEFMQGKTIIEAAGGMVFNQAGELLMMKRRGFWDMPKGKLDQNRTQDLRPCLDLSRAGCVSRELVRATRTFR